MNPKKYHTNRIDILDLLIDATENPDKTYPLSVRQHKAFKRLILDIEKWRDEQAKLNLTPRIPATIEITLATIHHRLRSKHSIHMRTLYGDHISAHLHDHLVEIRDAYVIMHEALIHPRMTTVNGNFPVFMLTHHARADRIDPATNALSMEQHVTVRVRVAQALAAGDFTLLVAATEACERLMAELASTPDSLDSESYGDPRIHDLMCEHLRAMLPITPTLEQVLGLAAIERILRDNNNELSSIQYLSPNLRGFVAPMVELYRANRRAR